MAPDRLIDQCRMADESKDKELRIASLQDVWDFAFPFDEYPNQRLSNLKAQQLLVNRSAEWVGQVILDSVQHATSRIQVPLAYVGKALVTEEQHKSESGSGQVISDDLRKLVQLGKKQFVDRGEEGAKSKDGRGDIE